MMWRIGILYRAIELLELLDQRPRVEADILRSFSSSRFRNVAIKDVLDTCLYCGWIGRDDTDSVCCTEGGHRLLRLTHAHARLRAQIQCLLATENPLWASSSVQGRKALASYAPPEAVQCFREAGLFDGEDEQTVAWWDSLACHYRAAQDEIYVQIGRVGEKLTVDMESRRTGRKPRWIALEYSNAGYDVISCIASDDRTPLVIEVKTSTQSWSHADFFLSRAEWDVLSQEQHSLLHLWSVSPSPTRHATVSVAQLRPHMPSDSGDGTWYRCRIPFDAFEPHEALI
jgi:hypothetical protein